MSTCIHCGDALRRDGLVLVAEADDSTACPDAPLRRCGYCSGDGCGSCEGYGEVFGPHADDEATSWPRERTERWNAFRDAVRAGVEPQRAAREAGLDDTAGRVHTAYTEPHPIHGTWTSPPSCHATEADAQAHIAALTALAGPDAAKRRTWTTTPCDGRCRR